MNNLTVLANDPNHENLLRAEEAAWLHDFWKCTDEHVNNAASDRDRTSNSDNYRTKYLSLLASYPISLPGEPVISLRDLVEMHRQYDIDDISSPWLPRVLRLCHNVAHAEKETVFLLKKQSKADTRRGNSFGYESEHLTGLTNRLTKCLKDLSSRSTFEHSTLKQDLEEAFGYAIADTERPINEVTLWDWSYIVAALYKAVIAAALLGNKADPPTPNMYWQLLSIRLDGFAFIEQAVRISDFLTRRKLINDGLDKVRELLEVTYPLGTEIYRDINGSTFIVPSLSESDNLEDLLGLDDGAGKTLKMRIETAFSSGTINGQDFFKLGKEVIPFITNKSERWTRTGFTHQKPLLIVNHLKEKSQAYPDPEAVRDWWKNYREDVCTVCRIRPQGWGIDNEFHYRNHPRGGKGPSNCQTCKALARRVCTICEKRREDRAEDWVNLQKLRTTIWIDEVSDTYGRIALVVGKFDLEHWLDGKMLFYPLGKEEKKAPTLVALQVKNLGFTLSDGLDVLIDGVKYRWHENIGVLISLDKIDTQKIPKRLKRVPLTIDSPPNEQLSVKDVQRLSNGHYSLELEKSIVSVSAETGCRIWGRNFRVVDGGSRIETADDKARVLVEESILHSGQFVIERSLELPEMVSTDTPARLYRVWETTRSFWNEINGNFEKTVGKTDLRLRIRGVFEQDKSSNEDLGDYHAYELKLGHVNLSVVHIGGNEFISADNLERVALLLSPTEKLFSEYKDAARRVFDRLVEENNKEKKGLQLEAPTGYGNPAKVLGRLRLPDDLQFEKALDETAYVPAVPILSDPETFMAIVPASKALDVVRGMKDDATENNERQQLGIKEQYEEQMRKARNRLPITVGVVFAGRRTPLPAILDAGRRMLEQPASEKDRDEDRVWGEEWEVVNIDPPLPRDRWPSQVILTIKKVNGSGKKVAGSDTDSSDSGDRLEQEEQSLIITIPTVMGDKTTPDEWFPYWHMKSPVLDSWVHVCDLHTGDIVHFTPSRFDFEFLETAAQRFEISYEGEKRRGSKHPRRPYYLEELDEIDVLWKSLENEGGLTTTQIHNLIELIEGTRLEWQGHWDQKAFEQIVRDALNEAGWKKKKHPAHDPDRFQKLHRSAVIGQLADVVELYMRILKKKPEREQEEG